MLKKIITKEEYEALDPAIQALYKVGTNDKYNLDIEDDGDEIRNALEKERGTNKTLKERLDAIEADKTAAEAAAQEAKDAEARAKGDVTALEESWQKKVDAAKKEGEDKANLAQTALNNHLVQATAQNMANEISTVPALIVDKIKSRLKLEISEDGTALTRVLDAEGKPSAMSVTELRQEFVDNKEFATIIKASNGSGGGAGGSNDGGGAGSDKKLHEMNATEESAYANEHPAEYEKWVNAGRPKT